MEFERYAQLFPKGWCQMQNTLALPWHDTAASKCTGRKGGSTFLPRVFTRALSIGCSQCEKHRGSSVSDANLAPFPALIVASARGEKPCLLDVKGQIFNALQDSKAAWDDTQRVDMLSEELPVTASLRRQEGSSEHSHTGPKKPSSHNWARLSGYTEQCWGGSIAQFQTPFFSILITDI